SLHAALPISCAGGKVERQLLGKLGILAAELVQRDIDVRIGGLEGGNDAFFQPFGGGAVDPADDTAAGDVQIDGKGRYRHGGGADKTKRKTAQTIAHSNTSQDLAPNSPVAGLAHRRALPCAGLIKMNTFSFFVNAENSLTSAQPGGAMTG